MSKVILPTEKNGKDPHPCLGLVDIEPEGRPIDGKVSQAWQNIVSRRASLRKQHQPLSRSADCKDAPTSMLMGFRQALPKSDVTLKQMIIDKTEVSLCIKRKFNG